jgi:microcystin-dependent protein
MATKTITELEELIVGDGETFFPVDDGIQTFKMKLANVVRNGQASVAISRTDRNSLIPSAGWEIFNTTQFTKQVYTGTEWINLGPQVGDAIASYRASAPAGFLACDGSTVSRTTYADLFDTIGTTYGSGDGSTTFTLPDTRRRVLMGKGGTAVSSPANTLGATGGAETHTLLASESAIVAHTHSITDPSHNHGIQMAEGESSNLSLKVRTSNNSGVQGTNGNNVTGSTTGISINSSGNTNASTGHNNVQPSLVVSQFIKF